MKSVILLISTLCIIPFTYSQNVGINSTGAAPDSSAALDVSSTDKGVLIPRVALTSTTAYAPITVSPDTSLLVYNTATAGTAPNDVSPGFYYWSGSTWNRIVDKTTSGSMGWFFDGSLGATHAALATYQGNAVYENTGYGTRGIRVIGAGSALTGAASWNTNFDFSKDFRLEFRVFIDPEGDDLLISCGGDALNTTTFSGYSMKYVTYGTQYQHLAVGSAPLVSSPAINTATGEFEGNWVTGRLEVFTDDFTGKKYIRSSFQIGDDWVTALVSEITTDINPTGIIKFRAWSGANPATLGFFVQNARLTYL